jgi:hypothetical protein
LDHFLIFSSAINYLLGEKIEFDRLYILKEVFEEFVKQLSFKMSHKMHNHLTKKTSERIVLRDEELQHLDEAIIKTLWKFFGSNSVQNRF